MNSNVGIPGDRGDRPLRAQLVAHSDTGGGAARALIRLHQALLSSGVSSSVRVRLKRSDGANVVGPSGWAERLSSRIRSPLGNALMRLQRSQMVGPRSGNFIPSRWSDEINESQCDVVNLHWIGAETMSIEDIGRIRKPVVWTLHDMWAFCGAEHVEPDDVRWAHGYAATSRKQGDRGLDIDRAVWRRKKRAWQAPLNVVTPSSWLARCAARSSLFANACVATIPNAIDTETFAPLDRSRCRDALRLPQDVTIVLFGAVRPGSDPNKGYDLLVDALGHLASSERGRHLTCVVFGASAPPAGDAFPLPVHWMGHIDDDRTLALLYGAADVMVVPSRTENLPQTATEAQACGCPVAAFNTSGLPDAIEDGKTGRLATAYDSRDLAECIWWIAQDRQRQTDLRISARKRAVQLWHPDQIVSRYMDQYDQAIADWQRATTLSPR